MLYGNTFNGIPKREKPRSTEELNGDRKKVTDKGCGDILARAFFPPCTSPCEIVHKADQMTRLYVLNCR